LYHVSKRSIEIWVRLADVRTRGDYFRFGSAFIKKSNQTEIIFFEKKTETRSNRPVSVRFGFLGQKPVWLGFSSFARFSRFGSVFFRFFVGFGSVFLGQKPVQTGLARFSRFFPVLALFFSVWLGFSGLAWFWLGLARFFSGFLSVSVRFGFSVFCL
jgi:hypothetical protein